MGGRFMASTERFGIGVNLENDSLEVSANSPLSGVWSLDCDIITEDIDATIQATKINDIALSGSVTSESISVNLDRKENTTDLDVTAIVNGINTTLIESQIVEYSKITRITDLSEESTNEKKYASSALTSKKLHDYVSGINTKINSLETRVGNLEESASSGGGSSEGGDIVIDTAMSDTSTNAVQNKVIKAYVDNTVKDSDESITAIINPVLELGSILSLMWKLSDDGKQIITDREVVINNNAIISGDAASGGEGQYTTAGIAGIRVNGEFFPNNRADGIIDLGIISGGDADVDLTDYYTKDEADSKFISTSDIGSQSVDAASRLKWNGLIGDVNALTKNGIYSFNTGTSNRPVNYGVLLQLSNKDNPSATDGSSWIYQIAGGTGSTSLYVRKSINGASWSDWETIAFLTSNVAAAKKLVTSALEDAVTIATNKTASFLGNIKIQPANRDDVSLSFISGVESDQFYDYKIGKFTDVNSVSGFGIAMANQSGAWMKFLSLTTDAAYNIESVDILRPLQVKKDATFLGNIEVNGSTKLTSSITFNAIANTGWSRGIKFMDADGVTQLSYIGAYGISTGFQYVYIGGTYSSPHFLIDPSAQATFNGVLNAKKDAYFSGHMYVGASSNLMLGNKTAGIYLTPTMMSWHNETNSWNSNLFGFSKTEIMVYQTLRPNTNDTCALGSSSCRWSGVHAVTGDFSGDVSVKGNLIILGDVASA